MSSSTDASTGAAPAASAAASTGDLLSAAMLARLQRLQVGTRARLAGRFSGEHRSTRHGSSLDFADFREYHPGDDYRRIDYALYARTDQLFLRLFEAEDDLAVRLVVDTSGSMAYHGKLRQAARLAAALGFVALTRRDALSVLTFPPPMTGSAWRRFNGHGAINPLMRHCAALTADGATSFEAAAADVLSRPGPPGVNVVISDLLSPEWGTMIDRLPARGGETTVVHVLAKEELHPGLIGDLDVEDGETGHRVPISMSPALADQFERSVDEWLAEVAARCATRGVRYTRVLADDDVEQVLLRSWLREGVLR